MRREELRLNNVDDVPETMVIGEMSSDDAESMLIELRGVRTSVGSLRDELSRGRKWTKRLFAVVMSSVLVVGGVIGGGLVYVNHQVTKNNSYSCDTYRDLQKLRSDVNSPAGKGILNDFGQLYERYNCKPPLSEIIKQVQQEQAKR